MLANIFSLECSSVQTEVYSLKRFVNTEKLPFPLEEFEVNNEFTIIYVNPNDLSYFNFENIIDLRDRPFNFRFLSLQDLTNNIYKTKIDNVEDLLSLDGLNLYSEPVNNDSRGGKRFIFSSRVLQDIITDSLDFEFDECNFVFRMNKFETGSGNFNTHYDTPFVDKNRNMVSTHTILIYLTDCSGPDLLKFDQLTITEIQKGDCFIFDQKLEHSGNCPTEGTKIFIRSELISKCLDKYETSEQAQILFNKACFFSKEAFFTQNLEDKQYSSFLFNKTMEARKKIYSDGNINKVFLVKKNSSFFVTDGHYFYFVTKNRSSIDNLAATMIEEYFGHFEKKELIGVENIFHFLMNLYFKEIENQNSTDEIIEYKDEKGRIETEKARNCCYFGPIHCSCNIFTQNYTVAIKQEEKKLPKQNYSIFLRCLDSQVFIEVDRFSDYQGKIYVNTDKKLNINFASCQCESNSINSNIYSETREIVGYTFPNIDYTIQELENGFYGVRMSFDIFENNFVYSEKTTIEQPFTCQYDDDYKEYQLQNSEGVELIEEPLIMGTNIKVSSYVENKKFKLNLNYYKMEEKVNLEIGEKLYQDCCVFKPRNSTNIYFYPEKHLKYLILISEKETEVNISGYTFSEKYAKFNNSCIISFDNFSSCFNLYVSKGKLKYFITCENNVFIEKDLNL